MTDVTFETFRRTDIPHRWDGERWTCMLCGQTSPDPCTCTCHERASSMPDETAETFPVADFPVPDIPVMWNRAEDRVVGLMAMVAEDHLIAATLCLACRKPLANGASVVLLALGPGDDPAAQADCRNSNRWCEARGIALHAACAGV